MPEHPSQPAILKIEGKNPPKGPAHKAGLAHFSATRFSAIRLSATRFSATATQRNRHVQRVPAHSHQRKPLPVPSPAPSRLLLLPLRPPRPASPRGHFRP